MADTIEHLLEDLETFPPAAGFADGSLIPADLRQQAEADRLGFWADRARELHWHTPFQTTLDWNDAPFAKWFHDGELNVAYNCLDRHVENGIGDRVAIHWEGEPGDSRAITYAQLLGEVKKAANLLESLGITAGDVVTIYLPMIPEAVISMLACARIGATHSVIFGGFSADSIRTRANNASAKLVITANGSIRKGRVFPLKETVDEALAEQGGCPSVEKVLVVRRAEHEVEMVEGRDLDWATEIAEMGDEHVAKPFPAEQPLFILYTSGTTGTPKGLLHTSGGYLTQVAYTHRTMFDLRPETDVFWCSADVGWVTGHSYLVYGPLANGATQVMYEGAHDFPDLGRWFDLIQRHRVSIFYTAPTAIRGYMKSGRALIEPYDLSSIRVLGSVGEPINPEAWEWFRDVIGGGTAPIVDTWWQTETGAHMIAPIPTMDALKPGSAQKPVPGIVVEVVDEQGGRVNPGEMGLLTIKEPWPAMARGIYGDRERFVETYWSQFPGRYFAGDGAGVDRDGDLWLLGRVDDVMNVSGHRLSTTEIESTLVGHGWVAESAVVGAKDETTGQAVVAFVVLRQSKQDEMEGEDIEQVLRKHVAKEIGAIARPREIHVVEELPKTRSGKIMRRLLRDVADGRAVGDTTTLTDASVMSAISAGMAADSGKDD